MIEKNKHQCPACGETDNVVALQLTLACKTCKEQSILWDKDMTQQLSNCCKAQVSVDSSDEGTSCFVCSKCKKACDLFVDVQLVIDNTEMEDVINGETNFIAIPSKKYERLKRLDENRKKAIIRHKKYLEEKSGFQELARITIELLENLDK